MYKDIREAAREAVRNMIAMLVAEHELTREEAYMLCSVAGDLKMHEVVSRPCLFRCPDSIRANRPGRHAKLCCELSLYDIANLKAHEDLQIGMMMPKSIFGNKA